MGMSASDDGTTFHIPVMLTEVMTALAVRPGGMWLDGTVGDGGHAHAILQNTSPDGFLIGLDHDSDALTIAGQRLAPFAPRFSLLNMNFASPEVPLGPFDGILLDLGVSSRQFDQPERGFSLRSSGPLDMRMNPDDETTLADLFDELSEEELANVIYEYGEEYRSRSIAHAIKTAWKEGSIKNTLDLAEIVFRAAGGRKGRIHPATRTFQALRLVVNRELSSLSEALPLFADRLKPEGVLVVISYHSLEDRIVKRFIASSGMHPVYKKPLVPNRQEILLNHRARSAKLRAVCQVAD